MMRRGTVWAALLLPALWLAFAPLAAPAAPALAGAADAQPQPGAPKEPGEEDRSPYAIPPIDPAALIRAAGFSPKAAEPSTVGTADLAVRRQGQLLVGTERTHQE